MSDDFDFLGKLRGQLQYAIQWLPKGSIGPMQVRPSATVGQVLTTTANGAEWQASPAGVTDHGALTGLADDDHPQYLKTTTAASTYQPLDADLTTIAGLAATTDNFLQAKAGAWASRTVAQVVTDLDAGGLAPKASPALTGTPTVPTAATATNTTQAASTAFVKSQRMSDLTLPNAAVPMNSQKFTGLAAGSANGDSLRYEQLFTTSNVGLLAGLNAAFGYAVNVGVTAGSPQAQLGAVGGASTVGLYSDYSHTQPMTMLSSYSGLSFGAGGSSAVDWNLSRTAANEATIAAGDVLKHDTAAENSANTVVATTAYVDRATGNASSNRPACRASKNATQSISNTTFTAVTWPVEDFDTDAMFTTASNTKITVVTPGTYVLEANPMFINSASGNQRIARIVKNGSTILCANRCSTSGLTSVYADLPMTAIDNAIAGDYYEVQVWQDSGGALNIEYDANYVQRFGAAWVGGTGAAWGNAGASVYGPSAAVANTTETTLSFASETFDIDGMHSTSVNTNRLTCVTPGTYEVKCRAYFDAVATTGPVYVGVKRNGTIVNYNSSSWVNSASIATIIELNHSIQMVAGDYLEMVVYQGTGASRNLNVGAAATSFSAVRVGYQTNPTDLPGTYIASMYAANSGAPTHTSVSGIQKVGSGGGTLTWTSEIDKRPSGVSAQVDTATNKRIDIRKTGLYRVSGNIVLNSLASGKTAYVYIYKNGSRIAQGGSTPGAAAATFAFVSRTVSLTSGDYLELYAYQDDSASEAYLVDDSSRVYMQAEYLGPAT